MMTKRDFEAIAEAILVAKEYGPEECVSLSLLVAAQRIADYAKQSNPRFDRSRFLDACGVRP